MSLSVIPLLHQLKLLWCAWHLEDCRKELPPYDSKDKISLALSLSLLTFTLHVHTLSLSLSFFPPPSSECLNALGQALFDRALKQLETFEPEEAEVCINSLQDAWDAGLMITIETVRVHLQFFFFFLAGGAGYSAG